jgi:N6-adenosine-specific RNA methylase IME4
MDEPREIILLSSAQRALAEAKTVDEVKDLRDKAVAVKAYAKKARLGKDLVVDASIIRLRAERKLGELLREINLANSAPGNQHTGPVESKPSANPKTVSLAAIGISKSDSSRSQRVADLPEEEFERYIADQKREPTVAGVLRLVKQQQVKAVSVAVAQQTGDSVVDSLDLLIADEAKFSTIYADPPWPYKNQGTRAATSNHYPTMSVDDICEEPVEQLCRGQAHLHLWTTNAFLLDAFDVIESWGFTYKSCFIWVKPRIGIGNYWRVSHEFLLLGIRGRLGFQDKGARSWVEHERTEHSRKPTAVREIIERVSPGPYLEMYGRQSPPNEHWTVYGNQVQ